MGNVGTIDMGGCRMDLKVGNGLMKACRRMSNKAWRNRKKEFSTWSDEERVDQNVIS